MLRIGSLFSGYEGIGLALADVFGPTDLRWVSDIDKGACKVLAHRFPDVPNLGDITALDWSEVEPVDVLTGGFPCQDVSHAGRRAGLIRGETRTGLWAEMLRGIATLRPRLVVAENVRGLLSARADSDLEPCPWCMGDDDDQPSMRALGAVLADLADIGYDAAWCGLRAADVGAAHSRFRVFILAWPAADSEREGWGATRDAAPAEAVGRRSPAVAGRAGLLPTPRATNGTKGGPNQRGSSGDLMLPSAVAHLLPTPQASEARKAVSGQSVAHREAGGHQVWLTNVVHDLAANAALLPTPTAQAAKHAGGDTDRGAGTPDDANLWIVANRLLPTPAVADTQGGRKGRSGDRSDELLLNGIAAADQWGDYTAAIARWGSVLGRPAPAPTMTSAKGNPQLSPAFTEWLMGVPDGWITDVPGITRNEALKACGNGVVPAQAAEAIRWLWQYVPASVRADLRGVAR